MTTAHDPQPLPSPPSPPPVPSWPGAGDWLPLPARGAWLAAIGGAMAAVPVGIPAFFLIRAGDAVSPWLAAPVLALVAGLAGALLAVRRHRRTRWKLDDRGLALRRGNWWQNETHVPLSRVQHLDLKRGPAERGLGLSTLVVHTAGTKVAALSIAGLAADDAERLRERLAHQLDDDAL